MAPSIASNKLISLAAEGKICTAFGIKITRGGEIVHIAKAAGYDSLFIDLEHTCMSVQDASQMCITAISAGVTPFVRVPHECGHGFIQRILDVGAMGVVVPHIHGVGTYFHHVHTCNTYLSSSAVQQILHTMPPSYFSSWANQ